MVMADVGDGILVVDPRRPGRRRQSGRAADAGAGRADRLPAGRRRRAGAAGAGLHAWRGDRRAAPPSSPSSRSPTPTGGVTAAWSARRDLAAHLKLRFARGRHPVRRAERSVIFLQDVTGIENQAQQLKLASMGRLTASIAHEVRNPLSAIGHATALLAEDLNDARISGC
jgi:two-component system sensor histidine kinase PilS (NtrC family)